MSQEEIVAAIRKIQSDLADIAFALNALPNAYASKKTFNNLDTIRGSQITEIEADIESIRSDIDVINAKINRS